MDKKTSNQVKNSATLQEWEEVESFLVVNSDISDTYEYKVNKRKNLFNAVVRTLLALFLNSACLWMLMAVLGYFPVYVCVAYCFLHIIPIIVHCATYDYNHYVSVNNKAIK